jgi:hypothetical protein
VSYKDKTEKEIIESFSDIAKEQEYQEARKVLRASRGICNYPQSRVNENKTQGWLFFVGFCILGIIGIISVFS